ncbi:ATP-binding protein [bacterium]|nr:ATP-binding protein [bacterium]
MVYNRYRIHFWLRMGFILLNAGFLVYWIPRTSLNFTPFLLAGICIAQIAALMHHVEKPQRDLNRFFDAIRYSDFTQTFSDMSTDKSLTPMKEAFNRVLDAFQKTRAEKEANYRYLQTIVHHVGIGLLVYQQDGNVDLVNRAAKKIFALPHMNHLNALKKIRKSLPEKMLAARPGEKTHLQFTHPDSGELLTLSMVTTRFIMQNKAYTLASFQNIQSELEEKELEAWQNLIRVLTHEIMNSITPIASLASTARGILEKSPDKAISRDSIGDVDQAVQTIETRSQGLLKFVQSYRELTRLPRPDFQIIRVQTLFDHIGQLMTSHFHEKSIPFSVSVMPPSLEITADRNLIEQVLINLLQNALYWCGRISGGHVRMEGKMGRAGRPVIQVTDNGPGIQKEALDKIFIPFFTTKEDGSGIGLSLSRQIMRQHKGSISVQSKPREETVFTLRF